MINVKGTIMGNPGKPGEQRNTLSDASGFQLNLQEIAFNQIELKWGSYINPLEKVLSFYPDKTTIVSHFQLSDPSGMENLKEKQFMMKRETEGLYELHVPSTGSKVRSFFELGVSEQLFNYMVDDESELLAQLYRCSLSGSPVPNFIARITTEMFSIISAMKNAPYEGYLKGPFLEAKTIELFLLQMIQLEQRTLAKPFKLRSSDIDALHDIRDYLALNYQLSFTITDLARKAGINQTKLKSGFKALFNTTVFGYLIDLRMAEAKHLLLEEKLQVSEVAERIGYKYAHHFTAMFKKRFGMLPRNFKR